MKFFLFLFVVQFFLGKFFLLEEMFESKFFLLTFNESIGRSSFFVEQLLGIVLDFPFLFLLRRNFNENLSSSRILRLFFFSSRSTNQINHSILISIKIDSKFRHISIESLIVFFKEKANSTRKRSTDNFDELSRIF